jgi:hypothetical protein
MAHANPGIPMRCNRKSRNKPNYIKNYCVTEKVSRVGDLKKSLSGQIKMDLLGLEV